MRLNLVHEGADELNYEIRQIAELGRRLETAGVKMTWENIGDPVAKGEEVPQWIRRVVAAAAADSSSYAYAPTKGLLSARQFLAERVDGSSLDPEDIIFFNGLGDAVSKIYTQLERNARVLGPSPAYPTHSSAEAAHAGSHHLTYQLDPHNGWLPDVADIRSKVKYNPNIAAILIINPDNPTGMVYPKAILEEMVAIADEYDLFLVADEIYAELSYGSEAFVPLGDVVGRVPALVLRGLSKEVPWPGARCGWIEVYNRDEDVNFERYVSSIVDAKMLEVGSTTLPQTVLPAILSDQRYARWLESRRQRYAERAKLATQELGKIVGANVVCPAGAFYLTVTFQPGSLNYGQGLALEPEPVREEVERAAVKLGPTELDKRFCYYLMGATGLCVVPLSGFNTELPGFRMTLLEPDEKKFQRTLNILSKAIPAYLRSAAK
ncbi:pyridoxal phosphate-dependent aminotransferase [Candidatus Parcubacteria bacterium]|nr:pyridoxal phosphate-dependent aminotransferase [Candidatus Parcubacteria bacterium]